MRWLAERKKTQKKQIMKIKHLALAAAIVCAPSFSHPLLAQDDEKPMKKEKKEKLVKSGDTDVKAKAPALAMSVGQIKGAKVRSPDGAELGDISDVVVERSTGRIKLALVSVGGFLGIGNKIVAVPWGSLSPAGTDQPGFILPATKGEIETAPGVESSGDIDASYRDWLKWGEDYFGKNRKRPAVTEPQEKEARINEKAVPDKKEKMADETTEGTEMKERTAAEKKAERKIKKEKKMKEDATTPAATPEAEMEEKSAQ